MDSDLIARFITYLVPMLLSLTVHEYSHALAAWWLGDDTASMQGRMTLNPIAHVDPIGTLLVPAIGIMGGFPFIGWAKPVPTNPVRYSRQLAGSRISMTGGMALVALAGPLSNLLFAAVIVAVMGVVLAIAPESASNKAVWTLPVRMMAVNVGLALFNMLPLPPLDGSRILHWMLPSRYQSMMDELGRYTPFLFMGLMFLMYSDWFQTIFSAPFALIIKLLAMAAGIDFVFFYRHM